MKTKTVKVPYPVLCPENPLIPETPTIQVDNQEEGCPVPYVACYLSDDVRTAAKYLRRLERLRDEVKACHESYAD